MANQLINHSATVSGLIESRLVIKDFVGPRVIMDAVSKMEGHIE